jgi:hypothetical protein
MIAKKNDTKENRLVIWFSSILRWSLGLLFMAIGFIYSKDESAWVIILFGLIILVTGFIRPKRCIDNDCETRSNEIL